MAPHQAPWRNGYNAPVAARTAVPVACARALSSSAVAPRRPHHKASSQRRVQQVLEIAGSIGHARLPLSSRWQPAAGDTSRSADVFPKRLWCWPANAQHTFRIQESTVTQDFEMEQRCLFAHPAKANYVAVVNTIALVDLDLA